MIGVLKNVQAVRAKYFYEALLKELLPDVARVAVLWNAANPYSGDMFKQTEKAARTWGIEIQPLEVRGPDDSQKALEIATRQGAKAVIIVEDPLTFNMRTKIVDLAARNRLPMMYGLREFVDEGGLIAYGANLSVLMRRAIGYVDKILRGAKPGDAYRAAVYSIW